MTSEQQKLSEVAAEEFEDLDDETRSLAEKFYSNQATDWSFAKLDDLVDNFIDYRGKTPPKSEDGYHMLSAANIKDGFILPSRKEKFVSKETYDEWTTRGKPKKNDVIVTTEAPVGEVGIIRTDETFLPAQRLITMRTGSNLDSKYLKFCLQHERTQKQLESYASGTTVRSFNQTDLRNTVIPLPQLSEQKKIGEILDNIERKILTNKELNEDLEEAAKTIFKHQFVDFEPYDDFQESKKGKIPEGFSISGLTDIADIVLGGTPDSDEDSYWGGEVVWAKAKDVSSEEEAFISDTEKNITQKGLDESSTEIAPRNSTIITARGTVGELAMPAFDMAINQSCYSLVGEREEDRYFIYFLMDAILNNLMSRTHGTVFDTITKRTLNEQDIVLPPKEEREKFYKQVEPLMSQIKENQEENRNLKKLRDTLLPNLMSGEIRVNDISLDDLEVDGEV